MRCRSAGRIARVAGAAVALAALGCTGTHPAAAPPPSPNGATRLVVLGGDSAYGADLDRDQRLHSSWAQLLLASLPPGSTMVDLAVRGAGMTEVHATEAPIAAQLQPTVAVIDVAGPPDTTAANDLRDTVSRLRAAGTTKVVILDSSAEPDGALLASAAPNGAVVADTTSVTSTGVSRHRDLAQAITAALR